MRGTVRERSWFTLAPARAHPMRLIVIDCFFRLLWFNEQTILVLNRRGLHD
jgi:hypothetical protein